MTDVGILYDLKRMCSITFPMSLTSTIVSVEGNKIVLANTTGTNFTYSGGIIEIIDDTSTFNRLYAVIQANEGVNIYTTRVIVNRTDTEDLVGKTVRISGGPLAVSRIFITDPHNVEAAFSDDKDYLIVLNISGGGLKQRAVGAGRAAIGQSRNTGFGTTSTEIDIEVACETKDLNLATTADEVFRTGFGLHMLKDQMMFLIHGFIAHTVKPVEAPSYDYQFISYIRPGSKITLKACVIEFSINII